MSMKAVIALGNPGEKYQNTRHNIGFMVADHLAEKLTGAWHKEAVAHVFHTQVGGEKILIAKPQTYMNLSGDTVRMLMNKYDLNTENIVITYDDVDLPFEEIRVRKGGGTAGHNGVVSIVEKMGTDSFTRVRIGVGRPENDRLAISDFVLENFTKEENEKLPEIIENAASRLQKLLKFGYEEFVSKYNN